MTIEQAPDVTLAPEEAPAGRSSKGKIIAAVAAVVVLLAGVLVTVKLVSSRSADGGVSSPDEAVENMIGSLEENDLLGVLDMFAPWERDAAKGLLEDYLDNAQDAGYVADDADLSNVGGYTLTVDGLGRCSPPRSTSASPTSPWSAARPTSRRSSTSCPSAPRAEELRGGHRRRGPGERGHVR